MPRLLRAVLMIFASVVSLAAASAAWALPGHPTRTIVAQEPADPGRIVGRWYEILRTPNTLQRNCFGAYQVWTRKPGGFSVRQVIDAAGKITGREIPVKLSARRAGDPAVLIASSQKIQQELGWRPRYTDIESIISTAWAWHRQHPNGYAE